ncbi:hypothetical protein SAMN05421820_106163 [Pedobacter steynii]|uniref:Uncharacterized protein n=1 Tax=Pedobacter steynii TaxID=430522 RepID=A0A1G9YLG6_9SPHI|nr:hypothetical protein SAMN05421820_106163 [Pedobacter steynii]
MCFVKLILFRMVTKYKRNILADIKNHEEYKGTFI